MARKHTTRSRPKKTAKPHGKTAMRKRKTVPRKKAVRKQTMAASKSASSRTPLRKAKTRQQTRSSKRPSEKEQLEKMTFQIEKPESGDLVVTEPIGGSIRVHHTVHPESKTTPVPGKSFKALQKLRPGMHEITVKRHLETPTAR